MSKPSISKVHCVIGDMTCRANLCTSHIHMRMKGRVHSLGGVSSDHLEPTGMHLSYLKQLRCIKIRASRMVCIHYAGIRRRQNFDRRNVKLKNAENWKMMHTDGVRWTGSDLTLFCSLLGLGCFRTTALELNAVVWSCTGNTQVTWSTGMLPCCSGWCAPPP